MTCNTTRAQGLLWRRHMRSLTPALLLSGACCIGGSLVSSIPSSLTPDGTTMVLMCRTAQSGNGAVVTVASVRSVPQEVAEEQLGDGVKPASRKAASGQLTEADVMQAISNAGELGCCRSVHCV